MTQREYRVVLKRELNKINRKIDEKIMWGQNYKQEARRHKELIIRMQNLGKKSIFSRALSFMTLF